MTELLTDIITLGGHALEAEDRVLRAIYQGRGQRGGLLRTDFERYYQFVIWKALVAKYDAQIEFNHEGFLVDLVITENKVRQLFEMKNWREENTARVSSDIRRLQNFRGGGYLLILSANPKELTTENVHLLEQLPGIEAEACIHRFEIESPIHVSTPYEFWLAGWQVRQLTL